MKPRPLRLDDQLCFSLYAATNAITRAYRPLLGELGLTYPQYLVMIVLWQNGSSTVGEISQRLGLGQNAITPLLDRLETAGLLARNRSTDDRRVVRIDLTEAGMRLEAETSLAQQTVECQTMLDEDELSDLRDQLFALVRRMEAGEPDHALPNRHKTKKRTGKRPAAKQGQMA